MAKARILIVEDESITAMNLKNRLKRHGFEVTAVVPSGEEAVARAKETAPDVVLMDIMLEGELDGIEAAERIRSLYDIPIVYLTAYADDMTLLRAKITEPFGYILKPFQENELLVTIDIALYKHTMEQKLRRSEQLLAATLRCIGDAVVTTDVAGVVTFMNPVAEALTGWKQQEALNKNVSEVCNVVDEEKRSLKKSAVTEVISGRIASGSNSNSLLIDRRGKAIFIDETAAPIMDHNGIMRGVVLVFRDITERKRTEAALRESEKRQREQSDELLESNTALKVLLRQTESEKKMTEEKILSNVNKLILPYIERLKRSRAMGDDLAYLNILEANLREVISPFTFRMSSRFIGLTPKEIHVANLIREGKENKEIADMLHMSLETVKTHRQNIRKKLNIYTKRINLRAYLLSFKE